MPLITAPWRCRERQRHTAHLPGPGREGEREGGREGEGGREREGERGREGEGERERGGERERERGTGITLFCLFISLQQMRSLNIDPEFFEKSKDPLPKLRRNNVLRVYLTVCEVVEETAVVRGLNDPSHESSEQVRREGPRNSPL